MRKLLLAIMVGMILFAGNAYAVEAKRFSVTLVWDANSETDLAGYRVYYGTQSTVYNVPIDVGNVTRYTINNLIAGTYYYAVTAYDDADNESGFSKEVSGRLEDKDAPTNPSDLRILTIVIQVEIFQGE